VRGTTLGIAVVVALVAGCRDPSEPAPVRLAIVGATLVDGTGAAARPGTSILVEGGVVTDVAPDDRIALDANVRRIDARGLWVTPGLVDTHTHLPGPADQDRFLRTLLAFGVTTARSTAAAPETGTEVRARLESGALQGPRFLTAGRLIDGPGTVWGGFAAVVGTEEEIRGEVARQASQGVDAIKLYVGLTPTLVRAGIEAAHARGLPVVGHLGRTTWPVAVEAGIDALTHGCFWGMAHSLVPRADSATFAEFFQPNAGFDPGLFAAWSQAMSLVDPRFVAFREQAAARRVAIDPNLVLCEAVVWGDDRTTFERLRTELDVQPAPFPHPYSAAWSAAERQGGRSAFAHFLALVADLHRAGVLLTVGSDTMNPWMTPGVATHRELELLALAGIPPAEVLSIATRNGAEALGVLHLTGTVEPGKAADLLLLRADPLADVANLREIELVLRAGVPLEPEALLAR
jgi:hypothetical protein